MGQGSDDAVREMMSRGTKDGTQERRVTVGCTHATDMPRFSTPIDHVIKKKRIEKFITKTIASHKERLDKVDLLFKRRSKIIFLAYTRFTR